jgi:hypothetical protein
MSFAPCLLTAGDGSSPVGQTFHSELYRAVAALRQTGFIENISSHGEATCLCRPSYTFCTIHFEIGTRKTHRRRCFAPQSLRKIKTPEIASKFRNRRDKPWL